MAPTCLLGHLTVRAVGGLWWGRYDSAEQPRLQELIDEGYPVTPEIIASFSPYKTGHINRFGSYNPYFDQVPEAVTEELRLSPVSKEVGRIC